MNSEDLIELVECLFVNDAEVYEAYSGYDQSLRKFLSPSEVLGEIDLASGKKEKLVYLSIYYPGMAGYLRTKKIKLNPSKCNGAKLRYSIEGWGLVHVQFHLGSSDIRCDISANSEKRAMTWFSTHPELKTPELWNWKEVQKQSRRIKRVLKKALNK